MVDDLSGQTIRGYQLMERIGTGGFGAVYSAVQPLVGREVAIKVILPSYANHPDFIRRFEYEAQLVARLEHPFIIPLYDYWREPNRAYLVMRWLRGGNLRLWLENGPLNPRVVVRLMDQIGMALTIAHRSGIVHRDLKPANILLDNDSNAYLADFGIAKDIRGHQTSESSMPDDDILAGSPAYLSPEQILNDEITPRTDIYSLGIILYECLTGEHPFPGNLKILDLMNKQLKTPLPSVLLKHTDFPVEVDEIIQKATAKTPADRYENVLDMTDELRRAFTDFIEQTDGQDTIPVTDVDESVVVQKQIEDVTLVDLPVLINPYKGLRAFQEADAVDFFGREKLVNKLLTRVNPGGDNARFLAVVGPSGSGKSSLVKAGLIPALRRGEIPGSDQWFITEMVPGEKPFEELASALLSVAVDTGDSIIDRLRENKTGLLETVRQIVDSSPSAELVLFIDQFEELFTRTENETLRQHFLENLYTAVSAPDSRLRIIITLRADFYDRPLLYKGFGDLVQQHTEVVLPLSSEELQRAITGPAERVGLNLDRRLVAAIVLDVGEQPGTLPLLQYALTELFERRSGDRTITMGVYHESGGVLGALARRAEELYESMTPDEQQAVRQLFLRMVTPGEGAEDTRRRVYWSEVISLKEQNPSVQRVLDIMGKYRLLTFDNDPITRVPMVEIAHEALIRQWGRLREWLDDNRESLRMHRRLSLATHEWMNSGQDNSFLASGTRLEQFRFWSETTELSLTQDEKNYLQDSIQELEAWQAQEIARKAREEALEQRSRNFLKILVGVLLIATVAALLLTLFAFSQQQEAEDAQEQAERSARSEAVSASRANSLALATGAQLALADDDTDLAIIMALAANEIPDAPIVAQRSLFEAAFAPGTHAVIEGHTNWLRTVAFSPDGSQLLSGGEDAQLILWDRNTRDIIRQFEGHEGSVMQAVFSRDGERILSASEDRNIILWDVETGREIRRFEGGGDGHRDGVLTVAFSPDGQQFVSGGRDTQVLIWDIETGDILQQLEGHTDRIYEVAYTLDGTRVLSGSHDSTVRVWDVETGEELLVFDEQPGQVHALDLHPDGETVLSGGGGNNSLYHWELATGEVLQQFSGHGDQIYDAVFSPYGSRILSASQDASIRLWDVATGLELRRLKGHDGPVWTVDFSPNGRQALTGSFDTMIRLWDVVDGAELVRLSGHTNEIYSAAFSPDGNYVATGSWDNTVIIWNTYTGEIIHRLEGHEWWIRNVAFSPDSRYVISGSYDQYLILWDVETGEEVRRFEGHDHRIWAAAYSPDGKTILSGSQDDTAIIWDVETGEIVHRLEGHSGWIRGVAYSPDSQFVATAAGNDMTARIWRVDTGEQVAVLRGHTDWLWMAKFSPDGTQVITSASDGTIVLWNWQEERIIRRFEGHTGPITDLAFSPDGTQILSGSSDGTMRLWDVEEGIEVRRFEGHVKGIWSVDFGPDGKRVLSGSGDNTAIIWRISELDELIDWVYENRHIREFSCSERELFDIEPDCTPEEAAVVPGL